MQWMNLKTLFYDFLFDFGPQEEKKFEAVEKEYEMAAELAKEEELELSLVKGLSSKKWLSILFGRVISCNLMINCGEGLVVRYWSCDFFRIGSDMRPTRISDCSTYIPNFIKFAAPRSNQW